MHEDLVEILADDIRSGVYPVGETLPSERTLMDDFGVSSLTVREAMAALEKSGLIETRPGTRAQGNLRRHCRARSRPGGAADAGASFPAVDDLSTKPRGPTASRLTALRRTAARVWARFGIMTARQFDGATQNAATLRHHTQGWAWA